MVEVGRLESYRLQKSVVAEASQLESYRLQIGRVVATRRHALLQLGGRPRVGERSESTARSGQQMMGTGSPTSTRSGSCTVSSLMTTASRHNTRPC
jgi:hypothetical protein